MRGGWVRGRERGRGGELHGRRVIFSRKYDASYKSFVRAWNHSLLTKGASLFLFAREHARARMHTHQRVRISVNVLRRISTFTFNYRTK